MDFNSEEYVIPSGAWKDHTSFVDEAFGLTSIEYDHCFDMVWLGHANGRVSSYTIVNDRPSNNTHDMVFPVLTKHCSFLVSHDIVTQLLPNHSSIVCITNSKISVRSHGGLSHGGISSLEMAVSLNDNTLCYTCGDLVRSPSVSRYSSEYMASSIMVGTSTSWAFMYDLGTLHDTPLMSFNVTAPTVKTLSNGHLTVVAGYDGNIRLLDGKFRSTEVLNAMQAHAGSIKDICMQSDGRTVITCGLASSPSSYQVGCFRPTAVGSLTSPFSSLVVLAGPRD